MAELALAPVTVAAALARGRDRLATAGCESPRLDAELLLAHALEHGSRARLVLDAETALEADRAARYEQLLARREAREPVAYILSRKWFRGICLQVDTRVLVPRPETELLVEVALSLPAGVRVADVGTGSGAVALALARERGDLRITGIDASEGALAVAHANGQRLGLKVDFVRADLLDDGAYDAVVANLPYVPRGAALAPEIEMFEPAEALYGGADGLSTVGRLAARLGARGDVRCATLEVGLGQAGAVAELLRGAGFSELEVHRDLAGHERVVVGRR